MNDKASPAAENTEAPLPMSPPQAIENSTIIDVGDISGAGIAIGPHASVVYHAAPLSQADQERELTKLTEQRQQADRSRLAQGVSRKIEQLRQQVAASAKPRNPYKNLTAYEIKDHQFFFGRAALIEAWLPDLLCDASSCRLGIVSSDAGMGKTSFLQAGVIPALVKANHLPVFVTVPATPTADTLLRENFIAPQDTQSYLRGVALRAFLQQAAACLPEDSYLFIVLDQFENFFEWEERAQDAFLQEIAHCVQNDNDAHIHWLIGVRSAQMDRLKKRFQSVTNLQHPLENHLVLQPLSPAEARDAVVEAAKILSLHWEPQLIDAVMVDFGDAINPADLQITCHTLVRAYLPPGAQELTLAHYEKAGRADNILQAYLTSVIEQYEPVDQEIAWLLLAALDDGRKRYNTADGLRVYLHSHRLTDNERIQSVLTMLQNDRLVRSRGHTYELGSASLSNAIRAWVITRAARKLAQAEAMRQVERMRNSALRGLLGGAVGFSLAYLVAFASQTSLKPLLVYTTALRMLPGSLAGLLLVLWIDIALASYHGERRWLRWLTSAGAGAFAFALAFGFHRLLQSQKIVDLLLAGLQGGVWGALVGAGIIGALTSRYSRRLTLPLIALGGGLGLWASNAVGRAFGTPAFAGLVGVSGALLTLCLALVAGWSRPEPSG